MKKNRVTWLDPPCSRSPHLIWLFDARTIKIPDQGRSGALRARRVPTIKWWSLDARRCIGCGGVSVEREVRWILRDRLTATR